MTVGHLTIFTLEQYAPVRIAANPKAKKVIV
jgi:hypothetical protein